MATAFPSGEASLEVKLHDTEQAVAAGAEEIDMVISREAFLAGEDTRVMEEIVRVKEACGDAHLKVILEIRGARVVRARATRVAPGDGGGRRLHQDLDRQGGELSDAGRAVTLVMLEAILATTPSAVDGRSE